MSAAKAYALGAVLCLAAMPLALIGAVCVLVAPYLQPKAPEPVDEPADSRWP